MREYHPGHRRTTSVYGRGMCGQSQEEIRPLARGIGPAGDEHRRING